MAVKREYLVVCQQVYYSDPGPFEIAYNWNGLRFKNRAHAIAHGLKDRGSDDFNIAVCEGDRVVSFDWMDEPIGRSDEERREECDLAQAKIFGGSDAD